MNVSEINPNTLAACSIDFILPSRNLINFPVLEYFTFSFVHYADRSVNTMISIKGIEEMLIKPRHVDFTYN